MAVIDAVIFDLDGVLVESEQPLSTREKERTGPNACCRRARIGGSGRVMRR
jgi:phosphoglycolate phosphatase-like HAD superfamily hydrolase